jgi:hypothetical protein
VENATACAVALVPRYFCFESKRGVPSIRGLPCANSPNRIILVSHSQDPLRGGDNPISHADHRSGLRRRHCYTQFIRRMPTAVAPQCQLLLSWQMQVLHLFIHNPDHPYCIRKVYHQPLSAVYGVLWPGHTENQPRRPSSELASGAVITSTTMSMIHEPETLNSRGRENGGLLGVRCTAEYSFNHQTQLGLDLHDSRK